MLPCKHYNILWNINFHGMFWYNTQEALCWFRYKQTTLRKVNLSHGMFSMSQSNGLTGVYCIGLHCFKKVFLTLGTNKMSQAL